MKRQLYTLNEVTKFIKEGRKMVLSGGEKILSKLPKGNWIGGTSTFFMNTDKGVSTRNMIFVDDLTEVAEDFNIVLYDEKNIKKIAIESFYNGFTVLILPIDSKVFEEFSLHSLSYDEIFNNPVVGFVEGVLEEEVVEDYDKQGATQSEASYNETFYPTVFDGKTGKRYTDKAVAIHIELPDNKVARAEILNVETIDKNSKGIVFPKTSFTQSECVINGEKQNIADFLEDVGYQTNYNLVADYNGSIVSRDVKEINPVTREVTFYTAIFNDEVYYLANKIDDYKELFERNLTYTSKENVPYSCMCMSYYMRGDLKNRKINIEGVFGFGEIAFHVLNRTLVFLEIDEL